MMIQTFTGPAIYTEAGKYQKVKFDDIAKANRTMSRKQGWLDRMVQHHFFSTWLTREPAMRPRGSSTRAAWAMRILGRDDHAAVKLAPARKRPLHAPLCRPAGAGKDQAPGFRARSGGGLRLAHVLAYPSS